MVEIFLEGSGELHNSKGMLLLVAWKARGEDRVWTCAVMAVFWVIWAECTSRMFNVVRGEEKEYLSTRVQFWESL